MKGYEEMSPEIKERLLKLREKRFSLLIIEDHAEMREALRKLCQDAFPSADISSVDAEASYVNLTERIEAGSFEFIVLGGKLTWDKPQSVVDPTMPTDLIKFIRKQDEARESKTFIFITSVDSDIVKKGMVDGADYGLLKGDVVDLRGFYRAR